jgi:hypothetical protein
VFSGTCQLPKTVRAISVSLLDVDPAGSLSRVAGKLLRMSRRTSVPGDLPYNLRRRRLRVAIAVMIVDARLGGDQKQLRVTAAILGSDGLVLERVWDFQQSHVPLPPSQNPPPFLPVRPA